MFWSEICFKCLEYVLSSYAQLFVLNHHIFNLSGEKKKQKTNNWNNNNLILLFSILNPHIIDSYAFFFEKTQTVFLNGFWV